MDTNDQTPEVEDVEEVETPEAEVTDWEAEAKKARGIAARYRTKLMKATEAKKPAETPKAEEKSSELDNADYALLAVKGYENEEDIDFIQDKMGKWNKTLREILRDNDVIEKLKGMKIERDVKSAMPSSTKRTNAGSLENIDYWVAKNEQTGELPDNYELRTAVINHKTNKSNASIPPWRR